VTRTVRESDIRVLEVEPFFQTERARSSLKFGNSIAGDLCLCHVRILVENRRGQVATGWGAIFLSHFWAFPTPLVELQQKDLLMRRVTEAICRRAAEYSSFGHPIDIFMELEGDLQTINTRVCRELSVPETMPYLGALVCASPLDAALHDAFGIVNDASAYATYGPEHCGYDLSRYLGLEYRGRYIQDYLSREMARQMPIAHTVGGLDPLEKEEVDPDVPQDGQPSSLRRWVEEDGIFCFKVKLRGSDLRWDLNRLVSVHRVANNALSPHRRAIIQLSVDLNEQCESPAYMVELLRRLSESSAASFRALRFVEQPTPRDLERHAFDMSELSSICPVVIDEGLSSLGDIDRAIELGWSGVALKTCKCQSLALLMMARAEASGLLCTVQDLSNAGIALVQSIGLAAHLRLPIGVEANARQYYPAASEPESFVHPTITKVRDGVALTATLHGHGLGYQIERIDRPIFRRGTSP
jgi:L-alanine-DL-glutamate epimerase-like enolase superfamily enzyme